MVEFCQGPTFILGLAGSALICKLAFLSVLLTVLIPVNDPAGKRLTFSKLPLPVGFKLAHCELASLGKRSTGDPPLAFGISFDANELLFPKA